MKNIIQDTILLLKPHVHIKNKEKLNAKLNSMIQDGTKKLQVVSDFDRTITKQHENGVPHLSSSAIFSKCPSTTEEYLSASAALRKKYYPIEMDPNISIKEKIPHMETWWSQSEKAIIGLQVSPQEIAECCLKLKSSLRDDAKPFFDNLAKEKVPVLVFSAGCGDVVATILQQADVMHPNVKLVSNFLKYDADGTIQGFQDKLIHIYNKNEYAIKDNIVVDRENVIVMGDSLGDADMTKGADNLKNVLKIGFLYERIKESLPSYLDTFDIVLVDDQTFDVPKIIFDYIKNPNSLLQNENTIKNPEGTRDA